MLAIGVASLRKDSSLLARQAYTPRRRNRTRHADGPKGLGHRAGRLTGSRLAPRPRPARTALASKRPGIPVEVVHRQVGRLERGGVGVDGEVVELRQRASRRRAKSHSVE